MSWCSCLLFTSSLFFLLFSIFVYYVINLPPSRRRKKGSKGPPNLEKFDMNILTQGYYPQKTVYTDRRSINVYNLVTESEVLNYTIVDKYETADILWIRKYMDFEMHVYKGKMYPTQAVNHILEETILSKKGEFCKLMRYSDSPHLDLEFTSTWYPETYLLYERKEINKCMNRMQKNLSRDRETLWLLKPSLLSKGLGFAIITQVELVDLLKNNKRIKVDNNPNNDISLEEVYHDFYLVQKFIENPLTLNKRKFSLRIFWLVASLDPLRVLLYRDGKTSSCTHEHSVDPNSMNDPLVHITNSYQQKKAGYKLEPILNFDLFTKSMMEDGLITDPEWLDKFRSRCKTILAYISRLFHHKLKKEGVINDLRRKEHFYALYGADITMDTDLNIWVTEIQKGPGMQVDNAVKKELVQGFIDELFLIIGEIQDYNQNTDPNKPILEDLKYRKNFEWVINDPIGYVYTPENEEPKNEG